MCELLTGLILMYAEPRDRDHPKAQDYLSPKELAIFDGMIAYNKSKFVHL